MKHWFGWLMALLLVVSPIAAGQAGAFAGTRPVHPPGQLAPCPPTPNCVVSSATADPGHFIAPIVYTGDRQTAQADLRKILNVVPRTTVWYETEGWIQAESRSRLLGFVDDVEFFLPADRPVIEMRSASRLGESDLGVNRRRLEQIRLAFADYRRS